MKKRQRLRNKIVSVIMVFLLVTTGLIQPVSAQVNDSSGNNEPEITTEMATSNVNGDNQLEEQKNALGQLTQGGITSLSGVTLSIHKRDADEWYDAVTDENGNFGFWLPDGQYQLDGIWLEAESKWYSLENKIFTVLDGQLMEVDALKIDLPAPEKDPVNVKGSIMKDGNPLAGILFSIHTTDGSDLWFDATTDANGAFGFELPDGEYKLDGIWDVVDSKWHQVDKIISVNDGVLQGSTGVKIELTTQVEQPVKGDVTGKVLNNGKPVADEAFSIHTTDGSDVWLDARTDSVGQFSISDVPNGEYQLDGVWVSSENKWYELKETFTVNGDTVKDFNLTPKGLVNGEVVKAGSPIAGEWLSIHTTGSEAVWYDIRTGEQGEFSVILPDGEYQLDGVWVTGEEKWYPLGTLFTVQDGKLVGAENLHFELDKFNVKGSLQKNNKAISSVWVSVHTTAGEELWYNAQTDENGKFAFDLSDGSYQLNGVWIASEAKWYPLEVSFEVLDDKLTNPESLMLDLTEPEPNVKGSVLKDGQALSGVWVSAHTTSGAEIWYDAKADENGRIQFVLPNGEYQIEGIWVAQEAKWYPLAKQFVVENGVLVGAEELTLELLAPTTSIDNVNGSITKDGNAVPNVQINAYSETTGIWYSAQADEQGLFSFKLPDGDYNIEGVWVGKDKTWYPKQITFSVVDGVLVGQSELAIELLSPTSGNITGTLKEENDPVAKAYMEIMNNETGMPEAILLTNSSGAFGVQLEDGDYTVESIFGFDLESYTYIGKQFNVTGGKLYVDGVLVQSLDVILPPQSLTLQLMDQGNILTDVSVTIETEINGRDVEFNSFSDETGNIKFRLNDGEYKVVGFYNYLDDTYTYFDNQYITVVNGTTSPNPYVLDVSELVNYTTVYGSLSDSYEFIGDAEVYFYNDDTGESFSADVDADGSYMTELTNGWYFAEVYSDSLGYISDVKINDFAQWFYVDNGAVYVDGTIIDSLNLTIPDESLKVHIVNNGAPVQGEVYIYNNERSVYVQTDENGEVTLRLPTGEYMFESVFVGETMYPVNQLVWAEHELLETIVVDIANVQGDVTGTVLDGGNPLGYAEFFIQNRYDTWESYQMLTDENGNFSADIPDGDYVIVDVRNTATDEFVYPNLFFTVSNGEIIVNNQTVSQLTVDLPGESLNVQLLTNGSPIIGEVFLQNEVDGYVFNYYAVTDENGVFSLSVPDGVYTVDHAYNEEQYFGIYEEVTVLGGTTSPNPYVINLGEELPLGTVQGVIQDENGPFANANFFIENENHDWFYTGTDSSGKFSTELNDGNYKIANVDFYGGGTVYVNLEFSVVGGKLYINGVTVPQLIINIPPVTVNGVIEDGSSTVPGSFSVFSNDINHTHAGHFSTDENGKFSARLTDGQYRIDNVSLLGYSVPANTSFEVIDGNLYVDGILTDELTVVIPPVNVTGTVVDENGQAYANANVSLNGPNYQWFNTYTNEEGEFSLRLFDGEYNVNNISNYTDTYESIPYQLPFTVQNGLLYVNGEHQNELQLKVPEVNFAGQIVNDGVSIPYASLTVLNKLASNHFVHVTVSSDENGYFERRFGDGSYIIKSMESASGSVPELNISFEVVNGVPSVDISTLDVGAVYGNVTGTVTDQGIPVTEGTLYVIDQSRLNHYSAQLNVDGEFGIDLPDNEYEITGFYSYATGHVELRSSFSVINGEVYISGEKVDQLAVDLPAVSLKGNVQDETGAPIPYASFDIKYTVNGNYSDYSLIHTNDQGYFEQRLADGVYEVTRIDKGSDTYPVSLFIEIHAGHMYVDGIKVPSLIIKTPPKTFFGKIVIDGVAAEEVEVMVLDEKRNTDIQYFHAETDENGNFSLSLPDGVYKIGNIYGYQQSLGVYRDFEVVNGASNQNNPYVFEVGESAPIGGNLQGIVMDENGPVPSVTVDVYSVTDEVYGVTDDVYGVTDDVYDVTDDVYGDQIFVNYSVKTNSDGQFGVDIPDGDYTLGFQGDVELPFSVIDGIVFVNGVETDLVTLMIPIVTLMGTFSENGEPLSNADINLYGNGRWYYVSTDENGQFTARLPDGDYQFVNGYTDYGSRELNTTFTINNKLLYQNGISVDEIQLTPAKSNTISGQLLQGSTPMPYTSINIYKLLSETDYVSKYDYTNENGDFSLDLIDGEYLVKSVWGSSYIELNLPFTITNGQIFVNDTIQDTLTISVP